MEKKRSLMMSLARTRRAWVNHLRTIASDIGIPEAYRPVISYLNREPGANQRNVAEFCSVTTSAINQTIKNMMEEGYVRKETDESDRRHTKLFLTEKGKEKASKMRERLYQADQVITDLITPEKEAEMIVLLDKIHDCIEEEL